MIILRDSLSALFRAAHRWTPTDRFLAMSPAGQVSSMGRVLPTAAVGYADSIAQLAEAARRVRAAGWEIGNIDSTVIAQAAKMTPHILAMRQRIGQALLLPIEQVSVKAKTAEKMGTVGRGETIEARAICLLVRPAA